MHTTQHPSQVPTNLLQKRVVFVTAPSLQAFISTLQQDVFVQHLQKEVTLMYPTQEDYPIVTSL